MPIEIEELTDFDKGLKEVLGIEVKEEEVRGTFKITNRTFQPLRLITEEGKMILLGSKKGSNVVFVEKLTSQLNNMENRGLIKIRKM